MALPVPIQPFPPAPSSRDSVTRSSEIRASQLRCRPGANTRGVESNAIEQIARGDVQALGVGVAEADIGRAHLLFGLAGYIRKLDRPQPLSLRRRDSHLAGPRASGRIEISV